MRLMPALFAATLLASPFLVGTQASAQNAGQIARSRAGHSCPGCNLFQADFGGMEARGLDFSGARLRQADLSLSVLNRTNFSRADLRDVNAYGAVFSSARFTGANLTNAVLVGAYLEGANFAGATLSGTNFSGAEMRRATGLTQGQLSGACGDEATQLPPGLHLRRC